MESYCVKCKKYTKNIDPKVSGTSNGKVSKRATCDSKKSKFIKNQGAKELLSILGLRTPPSKVRVLGDILYWVQLRWIVWKMNVIVNKFLLAGEKYMPEMHLKQPRVTCSACGSFTKNKEWIQKFKETGDTNYIYKKEFNKACFQYGMVYGDFKDLARRTASDKILRD